MLTRRIRISNFNRCVRIEKAEFFRTIVRALFKVEKTVDALITHSYPPLTVIPPDCNPDGDEAEETHSGKAKKCDSKRNRHIEQPETGQKRQEQHCGYNEFPTLQLLSCPLDQNGLSHCVLSSRRLR